MKALQLLYQAETSALSDPRLANWPPRMNRRDGIRVARCLVRVWINRSHQHADQHRQAIAEKGLVGARQHEGNDRQDARTDDRQYSAEIG